MHTVGHEADSLLMSGGFLLTNVYIVTAENKLVSTV